MATRWKVNRWWKQVAPKLRRALGYEIPTPEEAQRAMDEAVEVPMDDEEINRLAYFAVDKSEQE